MLSEVATRSGLFILTNLYGKHSKQTPPPHLPHGRRTRRGKDRVEMGLIAWLFGATATGSGKKNETKDDWQSVALDYPGVYRSEGDAYESEEHIRAQLRRVETDRAEFSKVEPPELKSAILSWMDYYERRMKKVLDDIENGHTRSRMKAFDKQEEINREKKRLLIQSLRERGQWPS